MTTGRFIHMKVKSKAIAARLREAVASPVRRAWAGAAVLMVGAAASGGPAFALGLFGVKTPERVDTPDGVQKLADSDPAGAAYNAALNGWGKIAAVVVLCLVIGGGIVLAKKAMGRNEGHHQGGIGGIALAIGAVMLVGGIAA
jgi:hypothetical protein